MMNGFEENTWTITGKVCYLKMLEGEFACSIRIEGQAKREGVYSSQVLKFPCLLQEHVWDKAKEKGVRLNKIVTFSGHVESWAKGTSINPKIMFVADDVLQVS